MLLTKAAFAIAFSIRLQGCQSKSPQLPQAVLELPIIFLTSRQVVTRSGDWVKDDPNGEKAEERQTTPKEKLDSSWKSEYDVAVRQVV